MAATYAFIETDGKQIRVAQGDVIRCDAIHLEEGATITFDRVVAAGGDGNIHIGTPVIAGASVVGTVQRQAKDKKILVFKYKPKKRQRTLNGHRQRFAEVKIDSISVPG